MHLDRSLCNSNNLHGCPCKSSSHSEKEENGENNLGWRIDLGELPQAENNHLWVANEDHSEHDTLENCEPPISEILELVSLHPLHSNSKLAESLEKSDEDDCEDDENGVESETSQEDVGSLDSSSECNTLDSSNDISASDGFGTSIVATGVEFVGAGEQVDGLIN